MPPGTPWWRRAAVQLVSPPPVGDLDDVLVAVLDVTDADSVSAAVAAAIERFGRIDVLVNNAGVSFKGYFEEMSPAQVDAPVGDEPAGPDERHPGGAAASCGPVGPGT